MNLNIFQELTTKYFIGLSHDVFLDAIMIEQKLFANLYEGGILLPFWKIQETKMIGKLASNHFRMLKLIQISQIIAFSIVDVLRFKKILIAKLILLNLYNLLNKSSGIKCRKYRFLFD